jgi:Protein of unknown function (DUF2842)
MKLRMRKFIGIILTSVWMVGYALVAMVFGGVYVIGRGMVVELPFYVLAGVAWIPIEMMIIRWMSKPDPGPDPI